MSYHGGAGHRRHGRRRGQDDLDGHHCGLPGAAGGRGGHGKVNGGGGVDGSSSSTDDGGGGGGGGGGGALQEEDYYGAHHRDHDDHGGDDQQQPAAAEGGGEWVEGPGYRMKTPTEAKRQQVIRGQQANERAERERQERARRRSKLYTVPARAQSTTEDGLGGASASGAAPKNDRELRAVRIRSVRARKYEQQQKAREYDARRKQEEDASIQRKLQKARRASEAQEAKQRKEYERVKQTVRSAWQQRQPNGQQRQQQQRDGEQIQAALWNSMADLAGDAIALPPPSSLSAPAAAAGDADLVAAAAAGGLPHGFMNTDEFRESNGFRASDGNRAPGGFGASSGFHVPHGMRAGEGVYLDPILDGTNPDVYVSGFSAPPPASNGTHIGFPNGKIRNGFRDGCETSNQSPPGGGGGGGAGRVEGTGGGDWDAAMGEVIMVLEWDVAEEVGSEVNRQQLCRTLCTLVKNVLRGDAGRRRVRDNNPVFQRTVGRWACGRRLMRLAGFAMEQAAPATDYPDPTTTAAIGTAAAAAAGADESEGGRADYAWVSREPESAAHINMLEYLVAALEEQAMPRAASATTVAAAGGWGGLGGAGAEGGPGASPEEEHANMTRALEMLPVGSRWSSLAKESEFTRLRKQQDKEFQDALRTDVETAAAAAAAAAATAKVEATPTPTAATTVATAYSHPLPQDSDAPSAAPSLSSEPLGDDADRGGLTVGGGVLPVGDGDAEASSPDQETETAEEKRAKIAASYARLGLGA